MKKIISIIILITITCSLLTFGQAKPKSSYMSYIITQNIELRKENMKLKVNIAKLKKTITKLKTQNKNLQNEIGRLAEDFDVEKSNLICYYEAIYEDLKAQIIELGGIPKEY